MGDDGYYGSNDWYGGKLGEEEDDPDWEFPHESGSRKRKRSHITDWYGWTFALILGHYLG